MNVRWLNRNRLLGEIQPRGFAASPRAVYRKSKLSSTLTRTVSLHVSARDLGSGKEASGPHRAIFRFVKKPKLSGCKKDAEENAEEDRRQFELAEARKQGSALDLSA